MGRGAASDEISGLGEGCQCVIWREGDRRCELWIIGGASRLRLFAGATMTLDEPFVRGRGWTRAQELRGSYPAASGQPESSSA